MGHRNEQRITVAFDVIARGVDPQGHSFKIATKTQDISCTGVRLTGLGLSVEPGNRIEVQHGDQRAWYRVQWVDKHGIGDARAGLRCLEPGKYIWGVPPKEWEPDAYDPSNPVTVISATHKGEQVYIAEVPWSGGDRRQFPRHSCRIEAQVLIEDGAARMPGTVTDISLGGCYVEMLVPLPMNTVVELILKSDGTPMQMSGRVCSSQTGMGMGVSFTRIKPADFEILRRIAPATSTGRTDAHPPGLQITDNAPAQPAKAKVPAAASQPAYSGAVLEMPDPPVTAEAFQAVVSLLFRKGLLTPSEFMEELNQRKATRT
jgi:PilZ domain